MEEINTKPLKSFTTEPKIRRFLKRGAFISVNRAIEFMAHLWEVGLKKCSYETLEWEFIQFFGSNDKRTIERYLGRPEKTERHTGLTKIVRMNRMSGKVAQFEYMNERRLPAKRGLLEILGYISKVKEGKETRYIIHHELMPYYTVQTTLQENEPQETANFQQESEESCGFSKEEMRVCSLYDNQHSYNCEAKGEWGKLPLEEKNGEVSPETTRGENVEGGEKKEEEVIDSTHTNQLSESENVIISLQKSHTLPLVVKPKIENKKCVECGRIDASNPYRVLCPQGMGMRSRNDICVLEGEVKR